MPMRFAPLPLLGGIVALWPGLVHADVPSSGATVGELRVRVTIASDGPITPDQGLTLREAIALTNGDLALENLSEAERQQVEILDEGESSEIVFQLEGNTPIVLQTLLPPLTHPGLRITGRLAQGERVQITPAPNAVIPRGLTLMADNLRVESMQFFGFRSQSNPWDAVGSDRRVNTVSGDVVITDGQILQDLREWEGQPQPQAPQGITLHDNYFGIPTDPNPDPNLGIKPQPSAFGVVIFEGSHTTLEQNWFQGIQGSAILTGFQADHTTIMGNRFLDNGGAGMADAIHLEGQIAGSTIAENRICGNAGSAVYLFKSQGAITLRDNQMHYNGLERPRAAVYLMGNGHQVVNNYITHQPGPGVVVAAYPESRHNRIQDNQFASLGGLSVDLVTRYRTGVSDYSRGDGVNPSRNSDNRRRDSGNGAVDAPRFLGDEVLIEDGRGTIVGYGDPGSQVDIYRLGEMTLQSDTGLDLRAYAPLAELLVSTPTDPVTGRFEAALAGLAPDDRLAALATDPTYGTSEPSAQVRMRSLHTPLADLLPLESNPGPAPWEQPDPDLLTHCIAQAWDESP